MSTQFWAELTFVLLTCYVSSPKVANTILGMMVIWKFRQKWRLTNLKRLDINRHELFVLWNLKMKILDANFFPDKFCPVSGFSKIYHLDTLCKISLLRGISKSLQRLPRKTELWEGLWVCHILQSWGHFSIGPWHYVCQYMAISKKIELREKLFF